MVGNGTRSRVVVAASLVAALLAGVALGFLLDGDATTEVEDSEQPNAIVTGPGPFGETDGLPTGYARTEEGAVAAATNFNLVSAKGDSIDAEALVAAMQTLATPEWRQEAGRQARNGYDFIAETYGADADVSASAVRYEVQDFSPDRATVRLWTVSLASGPKKPTVDEVWAIVTVDLNWVDHDWRVAGIESSVGPAPVDLPTDEPEQSATTIMEEFVEYEGAQTP